MNKTSVLPYLRVMLMILIINGGINNLILHFVSDSPLVWLLTGLWISYGSHRVFHDITRISTFGRAFKGVVMCVCWPLIPNWRKTR